MVIRNDTRNNTSETRRWVGRNVCRLRDKNMKKMQLDMQVNRYEQAERYKGVYEKVRFGIWNSMP